MTDIRDFRDVVEYRQWLRMYRLFRDYPVEDIRAAGLRHLPRMAAKMGGDYYDRLVADWRAALDDPNASRMRSIALDTTSYGVEMRQINPFQGVMTQEDLWKVIQDSTNEKRRLLSSAAGGVSNH